jgi:hypothetical protein
LGRGAEITIIFYQDYTRDASKRPTKKFNSKGESTMEYKLNMINTD